MPKVPRRRMDARTCRRKKQESVNKQEKQKDTAVEDVPENGVPATKLKDVKSSFPEGMHDIQLKKFLNWSNEIGLVLHNEVMCTSNGVSANYGMKATGDIKKGENIFIVPRTATLTPSNCAIAAFLTENESRLQSRSGWLPLILALMYEKLNADSKWRPYLDTFPNFDNMELPMFWPLSELDAELKGTGMVESVATDIQNMRKEYETILLPLIKEHPEIFKDPRFQDFQFAKQVSAFIMAYSFTDDITPNQEETDDGDSDDDDEDAVQRPSPTIMVPMADLLNHVPEHNAELNVGESTFRMIAVRDINKGEEVYNTYGKVSNYTLLLMYGFAVRPQDNPNDTVELKLSVIRQACSDTNFPDYKLRDSWLTKMLSSELSQDDDDEEISNEKLRKLVNNQSICLHGEGLSDSAGILKALRMDKDELCGKLASLEKNGEIEEDADDWMSDDEDQDEVSSESARNLDDGTKIMLSKVADLMLAKLVSTTECDDEMVVDTELTKKQLYGTYVRDGQILLLRKLKQWLTWYD